MEKRVEGRRLPFYRELSEEIFEKTVDEAEGAQTMWGKNLLGGER